MIITLRNLVLWILFLGITGCTHRSIQSDKPVCGLASPVIFTYDTVLFCISDYMADIPENIPVVFPEGIHVTKTSDPFIYKLTREPGLPFLSEITVPYPSGSKTGILVKNFTNEKVRISFHPGNENYTDVKVRGSLNYWNAQLSIMKKDSNGIWVEDFRLPPGEYQYLLLADGKEMCDPANPDSVDNNIGGFNSLLRVGSYKQEDLPFIRTKAYCRNAVILESNMQLSKVFAYWQNKKTAAKVRGNTVRIKIPSEAKAVQRSFLRVTGYNGNGISNDILVPLEKGRVVTLASQLTRFDRETMILYFIMIDRFYDGNPDNNYPVDDPEILPKANYFGGDIAGIHAKLRAGYFDSLGMNTLWLSPITQNPETAYGLFPEPRTRFSGYHGYWPVSSTRIDYRFGTDNELRQLIADAHAQNMNVLLDYVANHVHELHPVYRQHPGWATSLYLPDGSLNTEKWDEHRLTTWFDTFLPTLDLSRPEVVEPMTDSAVFWISEYGFDGFRHDATKHIDELFWRTLTRKIKAATRCNPMAYQIGETYGSPELIASYIGSGMLDAQFDFNVYDDAVAVFARDDESFARLKSSLNQSLRYYGYHNLMGYISGNQDKPRFISLAGGDLLFSENSKYAGWTREIGVGDVSGYKKLEMLHAFNLTIPGVPCIYYGDETGLPGANDPDNRRWMKFDNLTREEMKVKHTVAELALLRSNTMPLLYGDLQFLSAADTHFAFIRYYFDDFALVVFNKSEQPQTIEIENSFLSGQALKTLMGSNFHTEGAKLQVAMLPLSVEVFTKK